MKRKQYKEKYIELEMALEIHQIGGRTNTTEYTGVKDSTKLQFQCSICGCDNTCSMQTFKSKKFMTICPSCQNKQTCIDKYGCTSYSQTDEYHNKVKSTCMERYGTTSYSQTDECKEKVIQTSIERYGKKCYSQTDECKAKTAEANYKKFGAKTNLVLESNKKKSKQTCLDKYGDENYNNREKAKETCIERFGYENYTQTDEYREKTKETCLHKYNTPYYNNREKARETCLERYNEDNVSKSVIVKEKKKETYRAHYGCDHYSQSEFAHKHRKSRIYYQDQYFDSKAELDFYKLCLCANKRIICHPIKLEYFYNNEQHFYFPDFEVEGVLVEIKGTQFLNKETNKWCNPYDHSQDGLYEAKYDCAIRNGVKIIYIDKYRTYNNPKIDIDLYKKIYSIGCINDTNYNSVHTQTTITGIVCSSCGCVFERKSGDFRRKGFSMLCKCCAIKQTAITKYGVDNYAQTDECKQKIKSTCLEKYGVESYSQTDEYKTKTINTCLEKYGVDNPSMADEVKEKKQQTFIDKYGVSCPFQNPDVIEKSKQTCIEKYGVESANSLDWKKEKTKTTCLEKYGYEHVSQIPEVKSKVRSTCIERYGFPTNLMAQDNYRACKIWYNDISFDSKPELEFYKECVNNGLDISRHPTKLEYYYNDEVHYYFPDFLVNGQLVEIKGSHFLNKETGKWWNPYDHSQDGLYEAKYDCAVRNGVKIIYV